MNMRSAATLLLLIFTSFSTLFASHFLGGEITWTCLPNGKFVFHMNVYTDCTGIPLTYQNESLVITGNPLPTNGVTSILMKPDMVAFQKNNQGETSPNCTNQYGAAYSCASGDLGTIRRYPYNSDPVTLTGVPSQNGWAFNYEAACCRTASNSNITTTGSMLLRSIMYRLSATTSVDTCYDSSPNFAEIPNYLFCRGNTSTINNKALDYNGDSLSYKLAPSLNSPKTSPVPVPNKIGYSATNPTPDTSFNPNNIPYELNAQSGDVTFAIYNGTGQARYHIKTGVESWRNGIRIAEVFRGVPISVQDCADLPSTIKNDAPVFSEPFISNGTPSYSTSVSAGTLLQVPIVISDTNTTGVGNGQQTITMIPMGRSFSVNYFDSKLCNDPSDTSCATFGFAPSLDTSRSPARYEFVGQRNMYLTMNWQTDCNHLTANGNAKTHFFLIKTIDDHCPVPRMTYQTIAITVMPSTNNCNLITSLRENSFSNEVNLYPNPTNGNVSIKVPNKTEKLIAKVRNIQGQLVSETSFIQQSLVNLELNGEAGIYFIELINEKGDRANLKVVKR